MQNANSRQVANAHQFFLKIMQKKCLHRIYKSHMVCDMSGYDLEEFRLMKGWTRAAMSLELGIENTSVSLPYITGKRWPPPHVIDVALMKFGNDGVTLEAIHRRYADAQKRLGKYGERPVLSLTPSDVLAMGRSVRREI